MNTNEISEIICNVFGVDDIGAKSRKQNIVLAKRVFCKCARIDGYKLQKIGDMININHPAVLHHLKNFDNEYNYNPAFRNAFNQVLIKINKLTQ